MKVIGGKNPKQLLKIIFYQLNLENLLFQGEVELTVPLMTKENGDGLELSLQ